MEQKKTMNLWQMIALVVLLAGVTISMFFPVLNPTGQKMVSSFETFSQNHEEDEKIGGACKAYLKKIEDDSKREDWEASCDSKLDDLEGEDKDEALLFPANGVEFLNKSFILDGGIKKIEEYVDINKVEPNKDQPRKSFNEDSLIELSESIKQHGIVQPLVVAKKDDYFEIIAGERRWRAAKKAGLKEVPVVVKDYSPQEIMEIALIENIQREDLNPVEEAMAYQRLIKEYDLKQDEVAERVSKSRTAVTNSMRLLKLNDRVQQMIIDDMISTGHARALLAIEDEEQQYMLANKIFDEKLSVRETEKLVKALKNPKKEEKKPEVENQFVYTNLEEQMKSLIGTKVSVHAKANGKGKIEIEYYSPDDLERIYELLMTIQHN